ncbi:ABC transporter permease [Marinisporobacter balticus]|uniref:NitT/TauT family transport system permease protein n=1 Tax=Marinisporobacter balticus TaxID=2018667 RepID=A0A4R2KLZ3_9FIRM|nr:ABC transporter permease [Marinisporobacter balticus]TCO74444.1 NitT/TauT family transport system permease protein [Marinisporobacter balticus]
MLMDKKRLFIIATRTLLIVGVIALWEWSAVNSWYNSFFTSYPSRILKDLITFAKSGELVYHTSITLKEAFLGLFYGTIIGILLGILFAQFITLGSIFTPILTAISGIPQLALAPVYVLWFGLGLTSKVFLVSLMVFFCVFFSTYNAIKNIEQNLVESAHILGANSLQTLWYIVLPACMPWIISGIRAGVGACMVGAIIGEYMGSTGGFGWMITYATSFFMIHRVMSCITILLIVGIVLNWCLDKVEKYVLRWRVETNLSMSMKSK